MINSQFFGQQPVLRHHHVVIAVAGKPRMQAVAWFTGIAVADIVGQGQEVAPRVEGLLFAEELPGETVGEKTGAGAAGPVEDENRIIRFPRGIAMQRPDGPVVDAQFRQRFAAIEFEVAEGEVALDRFGIIGRPTRQRK